MGEKITFEKSLERERELGEGGGGGGGREAAVQKEEKRIMNKFKRLCPF